MVFVDINIVNLELNRYAARTVSGSNVVSDFARNPGACLSVQTPHEFLATVDIDENLRARALTSSGFVI